MTQKIIFIILLLLSNKAIKACSCSTPHIDLPIAEFGLGQSPNVGESTSSQIIFMGILIGYKKIIEERQDFLYLENKDTKVELLFKLVKSYKGWHLNDTLKIRTNHGSDACGFGAPINTECLIFADYGHNGFYYTWSSECCRSVSKSAEEKRFNKYVRFIESITKMIDGDYVFHQSKTYWLGSVSNKADTLEAIRYNIRNGKFDGLWQIKNREGEVLEKGFYSQGKRVGKWIITSSGNSDLQSSSLLDQTRIETINYKKGKPVKSKTIIKDIDIVLEPDSKTLKARVVRKQKIKRRYRYFD